MNIWLAEGQGPHHAVPGGRLRWRPLQPAGPPMGGERKGLRRRGGGGGVGGRGQTTMLRKENPLKKNNLVGGGDGGEFITNSKRLFFSRNVFE